MLRQASMTPAAMRLATAPFACTGGFSSGGAGRPVLAAAHRQIHSIAARLATSPSFSSSRTPILRPRIQVLQSHVHEPCFNLAFEERLFGRHTARRADESTAPDAADHTLFLWQNQKCVIMGKHQNPYREVHLDALRADGVELVRRKSGGGCVYQDAGNAIFTFISRDTPDAKDKHNEILVSALSKMGVSATASGRNDIEVSGRKISGCAFKRERGWLMHHGTMLVDVDMQALPRYLNPSKAKLLSKGVASVASRVVNLNQLDPTITNDRWNSTLADTFREHHGQDPRDPAHVVDSVSDVSAALSADADLSRVHAQLKSFDWVYGSSPEFSHEFSHRFPTWGSVDVCFRVGKGHAIEAVSVYSDSLQPAMIEAVSAALTSLQQDKRPYGREEVERVLIDAEAQVRENLGADAASNVQELRTWLLAHL